MRKAYVWLALAGLMASPACFTHRYTTDPAAAGGAEVYKQWHHHYLFGLISKDDALDLAKLCPSGALQVEDKHTFVNQLLAGLTLGIWSPTTVTVRCVDGSAANVEVGEDLSRAIVTDERFLALLADMAPERVPAAKLALEQLEDAPRMAGSASHAPAAGF